MIDENFSATFNEINSEFEVTYETEEGIQPNMGCDDKSFDPAFQEVVPTGELSPEMLERAIEDYFSEHPVQSTTKYPELEEKPKINGVELNGDKTATDLKLQPAGKYLEEIPEEYVTEKDLEDYAQKEELPTDYVKPEELEDYARKEELPKVPTKVSELENDVGYLKEHQDLSGYALKSEVPTVPEWSLQPTKPAYTAEETGADPKGSAEQALKDASSYADKQTAGHNVDTGAHNDLRLLIKGLTDRLNALADSDDTTLDQLSEVVAYIKSNKALIEAVTTEKISYADIVDNLTTNVQGKPLSAAQGVVLKGLFDSIPAWAKGPTKPSYTASEVGADPAGTTAEKVQQHNESTGAHADIRKQLAGIKVPTKVSELENDEGYLDATALTDKLIESGVKDGWNYRKWESGIYECWGIFEDTCTHYTQVNGFYGYYSSNFPYPIAFKAPPIITFNCKVGSGFAAPAGDVMRSSSVARCYALSTASGTVACVWEMNVKGRWK